jgi:hypothetical protein
LQEAEDAPRGLQEMAFSPDEGMAGADLYELVKIEQLVGGRRCIMKP